MGDTVDIILEPWQQVITLPKQIIYDYAPGSLLAQALEGDPNAKEIRLENAIVTPETIEILVNYSLGVEPQFANDALFSAAKYLQIPWMLYYAEPLYNAIIKPIGQKFQFEMIPGEDWPILVNADAANWPVFVEAYDQNRPLVLNYLLTHGFDITGALREALRENRADITAYLFAKGGFNPEDVLIDAARSDQPKILQALLKAIPDYPVGANTSIIKAATGKPLMYNILMGYYAWQHMHPGPEKEALYKRGFI